jgi:hypothetical protein
MGGARSINERDDAWIEAELRSLDPGARDILAALAVCGRPALSIDQLSEITELSELPLALAELEQRGLVIRDGDRYSLAPPARGPLKRLLASVDVTDRVLRAFIRIAEDGRLTLDDLDAVVELTRIAAQTGRWRELLRLTEAAETTLSTTHRVEEWVEIVERRREAAQALDDRGAARRAERELERLGARAPASAAAGPRVALSALVAAAIAAVVGVAAGYLISDQSSDGSTETVTKGGGGGADTVTETATETETVTETITTTTTTVITITEPGPQ